MGQKNFLYPTNLNNELHRFGYNARWGYRTDTETGLVYCQNRYYDPANGRWVTRDPIGYAGGVNVYSYCGAGPVGAMDPWGLFDFGSFMSGVGKALVGAAVGVVVGAVVVATAPAWVAIGLGVAAAGIGGWYAGQQLYEAGSGRRWRLDGNGDALTDEEWSEAMGGGVVTLCMLGVGRSKWFRRGGNSDVEWWKQSGGKRMRDDMGKISISDAKFAETGHMVPPDRGIGLGDWNPWGLPKIWNSGASPALRAPFPYIVGGSGASTTVDHRIR